MFSFHRKLPKIVIRYGRFLDPIFIFYCKNNPELKARGWNDWTPPTHDEILARTKQYRQTWGLYDKKILAALKKVTGLKFKRDEIDVFIVSGNPRSFSSPIVIKSGFVPDEFVVSLTEELIHDFFTQNIANGVYEDIFTDLFPDETKLTANHVVVNALLKYIFTDIIKKPEMLAGDLQRSKKYSSSDYLRAWNIVEEKGYLNVIKDFKKKIKNHPAKRQGD